MKNSILKKVTRLCIALSLLFTTTSYGQLTITDTGNCLNHVLHASITGTLPTGTGITADDAYSGLFPIGFTFNFYGTNYTQLVIGSNGVLNFDATLAGAYCPWSITAQLLGNANMRNAICGPWCDILISAGGSITRTSTGVAPNRKFAVTWCGTRMYSCTAEWTTTQIIIYETSNIIEVHTAHKTACAWNSGRAITGVHNAAGTVATVAPGRDWNPSWTVIAPPEAWRFTPAGPTYTVAPITYTPLPYATSAIYWYDSTTGAYLGTGPYLTVSPTVPTTYMAAALGCNDTTKAYIHVLPATAIGGIPNINNVTYTHPTECGKCDGTITLHGVNPHQVDTVFHSINGVAQPPYVDSAALDSTIVLDNLCGATYDWIYVKVGDCPSNQVGPITLVTPVLAISNVVVTHPTVCGKFDGSIKLFGLTPLKPVSVYYNNGTPHTVTGVVAGDSTFLITGLGAGNYTGIAATVGLCTANWPTVVLTDPPPYMPSFTLTTGLGCFGDTVYVTNTTTPAGYYSYWNYEYPSGSLDSTRLFHVYNTHQNPQPNKYTGSYVVALTYNTTNYHNPACAMTYTLPVTFDHHLVPSFTTDRDTVCAGEKVVFTNTTNSALPSNYFWQFGEGGTDNTASPTYENYNVGGHYTATLTATDELGCVESATQGMEIIELAARTNVSDTDVCLKEPMPLWVMAHFPNGNEYPVSYSWTQTPSGGNLTRYDIADPMFSGIGNYSLGATASTAPFEDHVNGCQVTMPVVIRSHPPLTITDLPNGPLSVKLGGSLQLSVGGGVYYYWSPADGTINNPNINNPIVTPTDSVTMYTVQVMNLWGCLATANILVYVDVETDQFVPSGFTPNGDGKNDVFRIVRLDAQKLVDFRVYNRWGECVFQTANKEVGWDGMWQNRPADIGTYTYQIIVALPNGLNKTYKGNVTLIR
ncbi:hypothetical protein GCM10023093_21500 [Nemorincola caseinilytica]|uniref:PKD domain-containing protein n=1 Tax=Nemorincola caseinilytica TaxID=2054315 RepID=A0ABP8NJZ5_9BACT